MLPGAGNSERTVLGDDDHDHSIEEIVIPTDTTEAEAHERVKEVFAKKRSTTQGAPPMSEAGSSEDAL